MSLKGLFLLSAIRTQKIGISDKKNLIREAKNESLIISCNEILYFIF